MVYLAISIIAVAVLVAIAIRRLPYLRAHRLGMEITSPRPMLVKSSLFSRLSYRISSAWNGLIHFRYRYTLPKAPTLLMNRSMITSSTEPAKSSSINLVNPKENDEFSGVAYPPEQTESEQQSASNESSHSFWRHDPVATGDLTPLPPKGLITRRGESQKIAHELIVRADDAFRKKNYKDAEKFYLQAATKDPDNARIYSRLGVIYLQNRNYKDAVEAFRGAIRFDDRVASRHFNLALAYLGRHDFRSAEKGLREAVRLDPTNDKYRQTLQSLQK